MTIKQIVLVMRARIILSISVFMLVLIVGVAVSLMLPKNFKATTTLVLESKSVDAVTGIVMPQILNVSLLATQVEILRSDRIAKQVVKSLGLEKNPELIALWNDSGAQGPILDWAADLIRKRLDVQPSREGSVIYVSYTATDPGFAAAIANAFAREYIAVNLGLKVGPAKQYADFFETQVKSARTRLEFAQRKLSDYQKVNGITTLDDRLDHETTKLNDTAAQLTLIQGMGTEAISKRAQGRPDTTSDVIQSPLLNQLKIELATAESKLSQANISYGPAHPLYKQAEADMAAIKGKLEAETKRVIASIDTTYQVNKQREQQIQAALSAQKNRVIQLNQQKDELAVLKKEVESAQRSYDLLLARADQTSIESQLNSTNVSVLSEASAPIRPTSPQMLLMLLGTLIAAGFASLAIPLFVESLNRRVRGVSDLIEVADVPVLSEIPSARKMLAVGN